VPELTTTYDAWNRLIQQTDLASGIGPAEPVRRAELPHNDLEFLRLERFGNPAFVLFVRLEMRGRNGWEPRRRPTGNSSGEIDTLTISSFEIEPLSGCMPCRMRIGMSRVLQMQREPVQERYAYTAYGTPTFLTSGFVPAPESSFAWETLVFWVSVRRQHRDDAVFAIGTLHPNSAGFSVIRQGIPGFA